MGNAIWSFFLPRLDASAFGIVQVLFGLIFLAAIIAIPLLLRRTAHADHWAQRLAEINGDTNQAVAYTTSEELSQAVATAPERWAEALPGLLLIFGLLGSFIGLGVALMDVASLVGGRAEALGRLSPVIEALGSTFNIATWGIVAFLLLKVWALVFPYEEQRLAWSARTMRAAAAQAEQQVQTERQQAIAAVSQSIEALLAQQRAEAQRSHVRHAELLEALAAASNRSGAPV